MKLTLIRHGLTEGNVRKLYYGSTDLPLLKESVEALKELRTAGGYPTAPHYYTSGMKRTEETLEALYGSVEHIVLKDIREIDFGDFEMRPYEDLKNDPAYVKWIEGDIEKNVCPNGESGEAVTRRALSALEEVIARGEDAVCITHGGVIGGLMAVWFPVPNGRYCYTPEPGTGYRLTFSDGKPEGYEKVPER